MGKYLSAINPCVGSEADGIAEGEEKDENDTSVIRGMVDVMWVGQRQGAINLRTINISSGIFPKLVGGLKMEVLLGVGNSQSSLST